jgi:glycosyltransferase involved in cell wall biosynthesis
MACRRPVVATGIEGNLDAFVDGHSGLYTEPDAAHMASQVFALLDDPARATAMGIAASRRAELFDLAVTLPALGDAVQRVVDARWEVAA